MLAPNEMPPHVTMAQTITGGLWVTAGLYILAKFDIAERLAKGPRKAAELARETGTHEPSLYRVLRGLASIGFLGETDDGYFSLTPLLETLRPGPGSLRGLALLWAHPMHLQAWGGFEHCVETGESAFKHVFGMELFDFFARHPEIAGAFDAAMSGFSEIEAEPVAAAYDFAGIATLADIGGGQGLLLGTILAQNPGLEGILFDLPKVVAGADAQLARLGVGDRCRKAGGDMFASVPAADAYILKSILHDFSDDQCRKILGNIREAIRPDGRVLIVQEALQPGSGPSAGKLLDLQMLLIGGRERTESEYAALYSATGFRLTRVIKTQCPLDIIEGVPA